MWLRLGIMRLCMSAWIAGCGRFHWEPQCAVVMLFAIQHGEYHLATTTPIFTILSAPSPPLPFVLSFTQLS